jgi:hypothetical protein
MARNTTKTPRHDAVNGNLILARAILEAIKIKEDAGLVRNPFTGRAHYKLSTEEAVRQVIADEDTAQLATLILETREPAFIDWASRINDQHQLKTSNT